MREWSHREVLMGGNAKFVRCDALSARHCQGWIRLSKYPSLSKQSGSAPAAVYSPLDQILLTGRLLGRG